MSRKHHSARAEANPAPAGGSDPGSHPPEAAAEPSGDEQSVQKDLSALTDRLLRLQADFDNYRKRIQRDQAETYRRSLESVVSDLLPVLDHFELGMRNTADAGVPESFRAGFQLVLDQLQSVLSKHGLIEVETVEQPFNPEVHEAVAVHPSDQPADTILQQTRKGYRLGDRLIRPSQVILAGAKPDAAPVEPGTGADDTERL
jgi:molecular chaperone GrpE